MYASRTECLWEPLYIIRPLLWSQKRVQLDPTCRSKKRDAESAHDIAIFGPITLRKCFGSLCHYDIKKRKEKAS